MNYNKPKLYIVTPSRKRLGKSIARGSRYSLAVQAWEYPKIIFQKARSPYQLCMASFPAQNS